MEGIKVGARDVVGGGHAVAWEVADEGEEVFVVDACEERDIIEEETLSAQRCSSPASPRQ